MQYLKFAVFCFVSSCLAAKVIAGEINLDPKKHNLIAIQYGLRNMPDIEVGDAPLQFLPVDTADRFLKHGITWAQAADQSFEVTITKYYSDFNKLDHECPGSVWKTFSKLMPSSASCWR